MQDGPGPPSPGQRREDWPPDLPILPPPQLDRSSSYSSASQADNDASPRDQDPSIPQTKAETGFQEEKEDGERIRTHGAAARPKTAGKDASTQQAPSAAGGEKEPYSVFVGRQRMLIIGAITAAGFLSPLTANIYLPAIPNIASDLEVSIEAINLSVTIFMIWQGISPLFFGSMTDSLGRRPIYLISIALFIIADIVIAVLPDVSARHSSASVYAGLMVLRSIQAWGSASVISIGSGTIGDITLPADRGGVMGIFQSGTSVGPSLGPVIGGLLTARFGWRSIFIFLLILGAVCLVLLLFFLPETLRKLVGNGSKPPPTIFHESLCKVVRRQTVTDRTGIPRPGFPSSPNKEFESRRQRIIRRALQPLGPLKLLARAEVLFVLLANAIPYTAYYMVTSNIAFAFQQRYGFTTLQSALVFIAPGVGTTIAAFVSGRILDYSYKSVERELERQARGDPNPCSITRTLTRTLSRRPTRRPSVSSNEPTPMTALTTPTAVRSRASTTQLTTSSQPSNADTVTVDRERRDSLASDVPPAALEKGEGKPPRPAHLADPTSLEDFPIESARFRAYPPTLALLILSLFGYGWTMEKMVHPSAPIIFTFLIGLAVGTFFSIFGCILVDYLPGRGATVTAANNFCRCLCGAGGTAVIQFIFVGLGPGLTFTLVAIFTLLSSPLVLIVTLRGPKWRKRRAVAAAEAAAAAATAAREDNKS